jgi:hypothetical protein
VDALGLIIAVVVMMAASATDNLIGVRLQDKAVEYTPTVTKAWVDAGFKDDVAIHGAVPHTASTATSASSWRSGRSSPAASTWS